MKKLMKPFLITLVCVAAAVIVIMLSGVSFGGKTGSGTKTDGRIAVSVLVIPKFEIGELTGDSAGEAQLFYENMFKGADEYTVPGLGGDAVLYVKDGHAMILAGEGKVASALTTAAVLTDERFDFSDAYIISTGCAGSAKGYSVMGDVVVITGIADYDLGHHADPREMEHPENPTWFHDAEFDPTASLMPDQELADRVYELTKDIKLETTPTTRMFMEDSFPGEAWAARDPKVIKGTDITADNYWKGEYDDRNAKLVAETYGCPDPFALTDMEEIAVGRVIDRLGMTDRYIAIRCSVNMDVFLEGNDPETLWTSDDHITSGNSMEALDIFPVAMMNNYRVVRTVVDAIDSGKL